MGYTHYWYRRPSLDVAKFSLAAADIRKVCEALPVPLGDGSGADVPEFSAECIAFNGHVESGKRSSFASYDGGLAWPAKKAEDIATIGGADPQAGSWFAGPTLSARALPENGDGSYESFIVPQFKAPYQPGETMGGGLVFDCCKTNYRPYDLRGYVCFKHGAGSKWDGKPVSNSWYA